MMRSSLLVLVGILILCAELTSATSPLKPPCPSGGKPGHCPKAPAFGLCVDRCSADDACPEDLKCCSNGCGHTCQMPIYHIKPGECPMFKIPPGLPCKLHCCQDSDCQGTDKCCRMGCSKICAPAGLPPPPDSQA
ncbi:WAP four-disulfide core domain protein 18-like [Rhineura floridana]|uniref:WAP four-disulfide core domain protein 18-like n=1 Tax=Rhineura floridana TaxID=261503 RepID=UPI002AC87A0B|nr:WAP four-disulfide core domain protein 18-like [Rhineura floridana]